MDEHMGQIERFLKKYRNNLLHLLLEEYTGFFTRHLPSIEGVMIRRMLYRALFKKLGDNALIYPGVYLTHTYGIEAGDNFSMNYGAVMDGRGGISLGNSVMVGPHAVLVSSTHQHKKMDAPMCTFGHIMQPLIIQDDVWIGAHAFIRGGINIGRGVVIGAGSMVLTDIEEYKIVGGSPARIIADRRDGEAELTC